MSGDEPITHVSSDAFANDPKRYMAEAAAGHTVEISDAPRTPLVLISKEELDGYKATAELLGNPEDRAALLKSLPSWAARRNEGSLDLLLHGNNTCRY